MDLSESRNYSSVLVNIPKRKQERGEMYGIIIKRWLKHLDFMTIDFLPITFFISRQYWKKLGICYWFHYVGI